MQIVIKESGIADADSIRQIGIQTYKDHFAEIWTENGLDTYLESQFSIEKLNTDLADKTIKYFITYANDRPIGLLKLKLHRPLPCPPFKKGLELEKIYLLKECTGQGLGEVMLNFAIDFSISTSEKFIWLDALKTNPKATRFYERHGFAIAGELSFETDKLKPGMWVMKRDVFHQDI